MPAVNRESLPQMHSPQLDDTVHSEVPVGPVAKTPGQTEVEAFNPSNPVGLAEQGSSVGSIASGSVAQLDSNAVVGQVKQLMGRGVFDWRVSSDECAHAIGLLESLPPREYARALKELSRSGDLRVLCEAVPEAMRRDLAESAVRGGATTTTPPLAAPGPRDPQPPPQPELIANPPSLPPELRAVIHAENAARGRQYEADFNSYVNAWCTKVGTCKSPLDLRELGPLSRPPRLLEPGIGAEDFEARRYTSDLCSTHIGVERAARAVSDQVSVFRRELTAGGFSLDVELRGQLTFDGEVASPMEGAAGGMFIAKGSMGQDGRVMDQVETQAVIAARRGHTGIEGRFSGEGQVEAVAAEVGGAGGELERGGKVTFKAPIVHGLAAETFVNHTNATSGADVMSEAEGKLCGANVKLEARIGFTVKGVDHAYYRDIGGTQEGLFGPMPELEEGKKWRELPPERRAWYGRQGFDEQSWPR